MLTGQRNGVSTRLKLSVAFDTMSESQSMYRSYDVFVSRAQVS